MKGIKIVYLTVFCFSWWSTSGFAQPLNHQSGVSDQMIATNSFHDTLEYNRTGVTSTWKNPDTQTAKTSRPLKAFQTADGIYCREFQQNVEIGEHPEDAYGTACRQGDGYWKIISGRPANKVLSQNVTVQPRKRSFSSATYGSTSHQEWFYPTSLFLGFGFYGDHGHGHSYRGYRGSREDNRRGWENHRGRGGDKRRRGRH